MKKNKFVRIVLIVLSVMILIGVALIIYILSTVNNHNIIKVNIRDNATQVVEFQDLCLIPGEKCEYTISIGSDTSDKYKVELAFHEIAENTLKNYVHIKIETNEEIVCNQLLATLFDNNNITLFVDLTEDKKNDIKIIYYLPEEIGNEAQNAEANFELLITASNE